MCIYVIQSQFRNAIIIRIYMYGHNVRHVHDRLQSSSTEDTMRKERMQHLATFRKRNTEKKLHKYS